VVLSLEATAKNIDWNAGEVVVDPACEESKPAH